LYNPKVLSFSRLPKGDKASGWVYNVAIRELLGVDKRLTSTMNAMMRDGLLRRVEHGVYGVA
jgi:hypothetical protein